MGKGFDNFMKNPFWKKYYEDAPSEACKRFIAIEFFNGDRVSHGKKPISFAEERNELEKNFSVDDWKHLAKYAGNNPFRGKCLKKIKELSAQE